MKFLAFDIEAANGYKLYSICSVGIVVADEQFNILWRKNVWINPKSKYNLNGTREKVGIDLHLDKALLEASPDFSQVYSEIKELFTDKEYLVVGHAVDSDVRMLNAACQHYKLPSIDFDFVCSQLLYRLYKGEKEVKGLSKIAAEIGVEFAQHNSEEDAYASLMTLKYLCQNTGLTVDELQQKYFVRKGSNKNFELIRPVSLAGQVSKRKTTEVAIASIKEYAKTVAPINKTYKDYVFAMARSLELSDQSVWTPIVAAIVSRGGKYTAKLQKCNVYVKADEAVGVDALREKRVYELEEENLLFCVSIKDVLCGNLPKKE